MSTKAKIQRRLARMQQGIPGAYQRVSQRNVPHLVLRRALRSFSICYFANSDTWKVFWPWPTFGREQRSRPFYSDRAVWKFLEGAVA